MPADGVGLGQVGACRDELLRDVGLATRTADVQCGLEIRPTLDVDESTGVNKQLDALGMALHDREKQRCLVGRFSTLLQQCADTVGVTMFARREEPLGVTSQAVLHDEYGSVVEEAVAVAVTVRVTATMALAT
eukprot:scaffold20620_cov74-Phaeocystis_antarctica.AAC.3